MAALPLPLPPLPFPQIIAQEVVSVGGDAAGAVFQAVIAAAPGSSALRLLAKEGVQDMSLG